MDSNLDIVAVNDLIKLAQTSTEEAKETEIPSPVMTRYRSIVKNAIPENFKKVKSTAINMLQGKKSASVDESDPTKTINISINWVVSLLKDLMEKVNGQTELLTNVMNKIVELVDRKETLETEFRKKHEELEADFLNKSDEKAVREKQDALEKEFNEKHEVVNLEFNLACKGSFHSFPK